MPATLRAVGVTYRTETEVTILQFNSLSVQHTAVVSRNGTRPVTVTGAGNDNDTGNGTGVGPAGAFAGQHSSHRPLALTPPPTLMSGGAGDIRSANDAAEPPDLLLCDNVLELSAQAAGAIAEWVKHGGSLISTKNCGTQDEAGRKYPTPLLAKLLSASGAGNGSATFVDSSSLAKDPATLAAVLSRQTILAPRSRPRPEETAVYTGPTNTSATTTAWEATVWSRPNRLVVHFTNATSTGGGTEHTRTGPHSLTAQPPPPLRVRVLLPVGLAALGTARLGAVLQSPYEPGVRAVELRPSVPCTLAPSSPAGSSKCGRSDGTHTQLFVEVHVTAPPPYGAVVVQANGLA